MKAVPFWSLLIVGGLSLAFWIVTRPVSVSTVSLHDHQPDLSNGEQVFYAGGCTSCHGEQLEGGVELASEFGTFYVPNISPDRGSGIGGWSDLEFVNAMMAGVSPEGLHYYPAFPYPSYSRMEISDVLDLKSYIDSLPAVQTSARAHDLKFPWNLRRGIGLWKRRYLGQAPPVSDQAESSAIIRGRYLVTGAGHCGECHTPRDDFGGMLESEWLAGGPSPDGEGDVPDLTGSENGLLAWTESDIAYYLESGFTPDFDTVGGAMVKVQENLSLLPGSDRKAIAAYLKSLPGSGEAPD